MKKLFFLVILISLFITPMYQVAAQSLSATNETTVIFDSSGLPQWAKDLRRFDIIAFGVFPFSIFAVNFTWDMIRWYTHTGFAFTAQGLQYAPWPLKSAGAYEMTASEYLATVLLAAGLSLAIAAVDLVIVKTRQSNERRRIEGMPSGSIEIERRPYGEPEEDPDGPEE
ncbi:MAG: hypothetical protein FWD13_09025 [Treponema sp.]|nr:hypothetical protein [Treponema sp.]